MRSAKAIALLLVLIPGLVLAQKKAKKGGLPEVIGQARYVYVEALGGDEFKPGLPTEDRLAIADVRDALRQWGRYIYTAERDKADLVLVVRKGRQASANTGVDIGEPPEIGGNSGPGMGRQPRGQRSPDVAAEVGGGAGLEDDMLEVCQINANGKLTSPLWVRSLEHGLNAPRVLLVAQFRQDVERAYPKTPDAPSTKP